MKPHGVIPSYKNGYTRSHHFPSITNRKSNAAGDAGDARQIRNAGIRGKAAARRADKAACNEGGE